MVLLAGISAAALAPAKAGVIDTVDGRRLSGKVAIDGDGFAMTDAANKTEKFSLGAVAYVDLRNDSPAVAALQPAADGVLPLPWTSADIGSVHCAGTAKFNNSALELCATGWGLWSDVDSGQFAHRDMDGDGQIIAQVSRKAGPARMTAGVMIRDSIDPTSHFAALIVDDSLHLRLLSRPLPEKAIAADEVVQKDAKAWMRVVRTGDWFTAYSSKDGQFWTPLGSVKIKMAHGVQAGLVGATAVNGVPGCAIFENVSCAAGDPATTALKPSPLPNCGIVSVDGTARAGTISAIDNGSLTLVTAAENKTMAVPLADVAWILSRPATFDANVLTTYKSAGVLLQNGDFLETDVSGLADGKLNVASVLFGPRTLNFAGEVAAVVLKPPQRWGGEYHVRNRQGVTVGAKTIKLSALGVEVGKQLILATDVSEIFSPSANGSPQ